MTGLEVTGMTENAWVALSLLHGLFALEHNAVCDRLAKEFPAWNDQQLFDKARLIVSALMAKIHTVEWTPAIMPHPIIVLALRTNWYGLVPGLQKVFPTLQDNEYLSGIPGSPADHHTAPYSLTEEFAAVYRMHSLLPDDFTLWSAETGRSSSVSSCPGCPAVPRKVLERLPGGGSPLFVRHLASGRLRSTNFPRHLQQLKKDSGEIFDIAAVDILRDRERGVPRYNQFRSFSTRSGDELRGADRQPRMGKGDQARLRRRSREGDLLVGLMCEPLPEGFGFSDTAFRVFI